MTPECYYHLSQLPPLPEKYVKEAIESNYAFKISHWHTDSNSWRADSSFNETDFMKVLKEHYKDNFILPSPVYLKNGPMQGYEWHVDKQRTCVINYVLTENTPSYVLFREKINAFFFDIIGPVPYILKEPFLFEAKIEHSVFNLSDKDRLIMSIGFFGPTYSEVKEFLATLPPFDENYNFIK